MARAPLFVLVGLPLLSGCGTFLNVSPIVEIRHLEHFEMTIGAPRSVYGGVQIDAAVAARAIRKIPERPVLGAAFLAISVVDLPFSAIGDTLTLPITVMEDINHQVNAHYAPGIRARQAAEAAKQAANASEPDQVQTASGEVPVDPPER